jgi:hypothetical protein
MTHQEYTALGLAAVCLVTNSLGAAFTIKRVYSKWAKQQPEQLACVADDIDEVANQRRYGHPALLLDSSSIRWLPATPFSHPTYLDLPEMLQIRRRGMSRLSAQCKPDAPGGSV